MIKRTKRDPLLRLDFYFNPRSWSIFQSWFDEQAFSDRTEALNRLILEFHRVRTQSGLSQDFLASHRK